MSTATKVRPSPRPGSRAKPPVEEQAEQPAGGRRRTLLLAALAVVVVAAVATWFLVLREDTAAAPEQVPGEVLVLDPISVNLSNGQYLRFGLALQVVEGAAHSPDGSKALDIAISTLSGRDAAALGDAEQREAVKAELRERIAGAYDDEVMDIYFTEFVTQ